MSNLTRALLHELVDATEPPKLDCVRLLLSFKKTSISKIAKKAKVSRQAAYEDISGGHRCPRFRKEIEKIFGSIPWT